jgi:hypothetical protein
MSTGYASGPGRRTGGHASLAGVLALAVAPLAFLGGGYPSFSIAPLTGLLVLLVPRFVHVGPIESAVDRVLEGAVRGVIALAVPPLVLPARAHSFVIEGAARTLDLMAGSLPELFEGFIRPHDAAAIARIQDGIGRSCCTHPSAVEAKHGRIVFLAAEADHGPLLRALTGLRHDLVMIGLTTAEPLPSRSNRGSDCRRASRLTRSTAWQRRSAGWSARAGVAGGGRSRLRPLRLRDLAVSRSRAGDKRRPECKLGAVKEIILP